MQLRLLPWAVFVAEISKCLAKGLELDVPILGGRLIGGEIHEPPLQVLCDGGRSAADLALPERRLLVEQLGRREDAIAAKLHVLGTEVVPGYAKIGSAELGGERVVGVDVARRLSLRPKEL